MFREMKGNEKGFTLVELIVVIAILAVLATLLIPRIMGNVAEARKQRDITTAQTLASEITIYNAKQKSDNDLSTNGITTSPVVEGDLTTAHIALPSGVTFPNPANVTILIDSNGNASLHIIS